MHLIEKYDGGSWKIDSMLGAGFSGKVYKISKIGSNPPIQEALKVFSLPEIRQIIKNSHPEFDSAQLDRCADLQLDSAREKILAFQEADSPYILSYHHFEVVETDEDPGPHFFLRMELLQSLELAYALNHSSEKDVCRLGVDICSALELYAKNGLVHGNIKPSEIFLAQNGGYKLGGFEHSHPADAKPANAGIVGARYYTAPEVEKGLNSGNSDLYSLGMVMHQLLNNGRMPFVSQGKSAKPGETIEARFKRLKGDALPPPVNASPALAAIVLKACAFDGEKRYQSTTEMKNALLGINSFR
ncbi:MAG: protein kinase [Clostridiales bacterium]|jgi:serine/threonine protein kinase|nr:protein kinase [Clostridiales bacterium]